MKIIKYLIRQYKNIANAELPEHKTGHLVFFKTLLFMTPFCAIPLFMLETDTIGFGFFCLALVIGVIGVIVEARNVKRLDRRKTNQHLIEKIRKN